jgi:hypothetical protein
MFCEFVVFVCGFIFVVLCSSKQPGGWLDSLRFRTVRSCLHVCGFVLFLAAWLLVALLYPLCLVAFL